MSIIPHPAPLPIGPKESNHGLGATVDTFAKALATVAALAYAAGLLIVNSNLALFKVSTFSLNHAQYVLVGAVWLLSAALSAFFPVAAALMTPFLRFRSLKGGASIVLMIGIGTYLLFSIGQTVSPPHVPALSLMGYGFWEVSVYVLINVQLNTSKISHLAETRIVPVRPGSTTGLVLSFVVPLILLVTSAGIYAICIFPDMDPTNGGGKPPTGTVVFRYPEKGDETELATALQPIRLIGLSTEKVKVVLVDTDFVVLVSERDTSKPVLVSKGLIASIRYD